MSALLSFRDLTLALAASPRGARPPILDAVSFDVAPGEVLAVVGESGSGKTMAARAAMRLLPPGIGAASGDVMFDGRSILSMPDAALRRVRGAQIGMVFQEPMVSLNPAITVGAQLVEGLRLHEKVGLDAALGRAVAMLRQVRIADPEACLAAYPHQFSGGMRQRIMLASVMLLRPRLLIADEPTTALDTLAQREVLEMMVELTRSAGTAVMLITHNLGLVARYAGSVVVLERGRVVEQGFTMRVLRRPEQPYTRTLIDALPRRDPGRAGVTHAPEVIAASDLSVTFGGAGRAFSTAAPKHAVRGVTLSVRQGEVVAVVGGSGSGKTTLGRAMIGLVPLAGGSVRFRGGIVDGAGPAARRDFRLNCQLVFQDPYSSLDPRQTVGQIVAEPLRHVPGLGRRAREQRAERMLAEVGLDGFAGRHPHALSGGQRQRVAIARAVIRNPAFLVADEPVSALDMTIQKQVLDLFRRLQANHGFGCLFISHDLGAVSQVADRIVVMQDGAIVEEGRVSDIMDAPRHPYTRALMEAAPSLALAEAPATVRSAL
jgi:peptide/nickel transport system ATP-binding protein